MDIKVRMEQRQGEDTCDERHRESRGRDDRGISRILQCKTDVEGDINHEK